MQGTAGFLQGKENPLQQVYLLVIAYRDKKCWPCKVSWMLLRFPMRQVVLQIVSHPLLLCIATLPSLALDLNVHQAQALLLDLYQERL